MCDLCATVHTTSRCLVFVVRDADTTAESRGGVCLRGLAATRQWTHMRTGDRYFTGAGRVSTVPVGEGVLVSCRVALAAAGALGCCVVGMGHG